MAELDLTAAIEAAAIAMWEKSCGGELPWADAQEWDRDNYLEYIRVGIEAALPEMREQLAEQIEAELVCCDIYDRVNELDQAAAMKLMSSPGFHHICHWGGYAAAIVGGQP